MLTDSVAEQMTAAMKAKDAPKLSTLRMLRAALKNAEIEQRAPLTDEQATSVIASEVKKLKDALEQFRSGGRQDLVASSESEIAILQGFLPAAASAEEIRAVVARVATGATPADFGRVMGAAMKELKGKADGTAVGAIVKEILSSS